MSADTDHKAYMKSKIDDFLKGFTTQALTERPENLELFLLEYVKVALGLKLSESEQDELKSLRQILKNIDKGKDSNSETSSDDDEIEDLPIETSSKKLKTRASVSAEAFGE